MEQITFKVLCAHHACDHFKATMYNENRETEADLKMNIQLPVKNIHP